MTEDERQDADVLRWRFSRHLGDLKSQLSEADDADARIAVMIKFLPAISGYFQPGVPWQDACLDAIWKTWAASAFDPAGADARARIVQWCTQGMISSLIAEEPLISVDQVLMLLSLMLDPTIH